MKVSCVVWKRKVLLSRLSNQDPDLRRAEHTEKEARTTLETQHEVLRSYCKEERANQLQSLVDQLQAYPEPRSCAREGHVITQVTTGSVETVSFEEMHLLQEEAKQSVYHQVNSGSEYANEGVRVRNSSDQVLKAVSSHSKIKQSKSFLYISAEEDFFAEMQKKGLQERKGNKPFTAVPKTLFD